MFTERLGGKSRLIQLWPRPERVRVMPMLFLRHYFLALKYTNPWAALFIACNMVIGLTQRRRGEPAGFWRYLPVIGAVIDWWQFWITAWKTDYFGKLLICLLLIALLTMAGTSWFVVASIR